METPNPSPPATPSTPEVLEIGWDELNSPETTATVAQLREAQTMPLVRQVGAPEQAPAHWYNASLAQSAFAGVLGGVVTWGITELLIANSGWSATANNIAFTVTCALGIGLVLVLWDSLSTRSAAKLGLDLRHKGPVVTGIALVAGIVINWIYQSWIQAMVSQLLIQSSAAGWSTRQFEQAIQSQIHLPRGVAWALVGMAVGAGVGVAYRQRQRIINGVIGGAIGGFIAGFAFDFFTGGVAARLFGILFTGVAIGLGIGLVEQARRQHWLEIRSGGMAGKQFILYSGTTSIGSAPTCDMTLIKDPAIAPHHLTLSAGEHGLSITAAPDAVVLVNGQPTDGRALRDGDVLTIGSTVLGYRDKSEVAIPTGPIVG